MIDRILHTLRTVYRRPVVVYPSGQGFGTHVMTGVLLTADVVWFVDHYADTLQWSQSGGLALPDDHTPPQFLAELIILHDKRSRVVTVYTFFTTRTRQGTRLETLLYAWVRHSTQWRTANYNPTAQPHGDEPVRVYDYDAAMKLFNRIDRHMRHAD